MTTEKKQLLYAPRQDGRSKKGTAQKSFLENRKEIETLYQKGNPVSYIRDKMLVEGKVQVGYVQFLKLIKKHVNSPKQTETKSEIVLHCYENSSGKLKEKTHKKINSRLGKDVF